MNKLSVAVTALVAMLIFGCAHTNSAPFEQEVRKAYLLQVEENYESAIKKWQSIVSEGHDEAVIAEANYNIGKCYYKTGRKEEALSIFRDTAEKHPWRQWGAYSSQAIADLNKRDGNIEQAIKGYMDIIEKYERYVRIKEYDFESDLKGSVEFRRLTDVRPKISLEKELSGILEFLYIKDVLRSAYFGIAQYYENESKDCEKAISVYERMIELFPQPKDSDSFLAMLEILRCEALSKKVDPYERLYEFTVNNPDSRYAPRILWLVGLNSLYKEVAVEKALDIFQAVISKYPSSPAALEAYISMGEHYMKSGRKEEALAIFKKLDADYPETYRMSVIKAYIYKIEHGIEGH